MIYSPLPLQPSWIKTHVLFDSYAPEDIDSSINALLPRLVQDRYHEQCLLDIKSQDVDPSLIQQPRPARSAENMLLQSASNVDEAVNGNITTAQSQTSSSRLLLVRQTQMMRLIWDRLSQSRSTRRRSSDSDTEIQPPKKKTRSVFEENTCTTIELYYSNTHTYGSSI